MTETSKVAEVPPTPANADIPLKLSKEEENQRYQFIGKCVDKGINFPNSTKFGVTNVMTVQDLCNSTIVTLAKIASTVKKEEAEHDPEFSPVKTAILKVAGIPATDWLCFFRLTIRKKYWDAYASDRRAQRKVLEARIAASRTPEELRKEAELELANLNAEFAKED